MTCWTHVWKGHSVSSLDLWAFCDNCGQWRWDPYCTQIKGANR